MYELKKKIGKVFTSKFFGIGPSSYSYKKGIYRAAVSQRLRNIGVGSGLFEDLIPRTEESYRLCVSNCV